MEKYLCVCNKCKAKFEGIAEEGKTIVCPACGHDKATILEKIEAGCDGCSGCTGCH